MNAPGTAELLERLRPAHGTEAQLGVAGVLSPPPAPASQPWTRVCSESWMRLCTVLRIPRHP